MIGKFFYIPKSKSFSITPRFHDPAQEERDARVKRVKEDLGIKEEGDENKPYNPNVKGQFRNSGSWQTKSTSEARRSSNTRLIVLIIIFSILAYLLFYSDFNFF